MLGRLGSRIGWVGGVLSSGLDAGMDVKMLGSAFWDWVGAGVILGI